ncbi:hydrolase of the alpha/beta superfamily [Paraphoma chrysanthemicola]|nr:hydrolase of the alpha/beta superfamily [Paraphoma chrysanthemicola]
MAGRIVAVLGGTMIAGATMATAQNMSFGANNFYISSNVTVEPITFSSYKLNRTVNASAIIVGPLFGAVKEQSANLYATKLAEQGFVAISIDPAYWGVSGGEPRNAVLLDMYAESFSAAVDYLTLQEYVDRERIGVLGICGSGSWLITAVKIDTRIKALATVSMYDMGAAYRDEFFDFYRTSRGEFTPESSAPTLTTYLTLTSAMRLINYYSLEGLNILYLRPVLFIAGTQAHSREFAEDAYYLAAYPKELFWVEGAGHVDLYD